jgi:hypothetical protein
VKLINWLQLIRSRDRFATPQIFTMPSGYSSRDVGDSQAKKNKQSMADLKLRRLTELNNRLREDLERERIPVSQAAKRYFTINPICTLQDIALTHAL